MLCQLVASKIENDVYGDMQIEESLESLIALQCKWLWLCSKTICKLELNLKHLSCSNKCCFSRTLTWSCFNYYNEWLWVVAMKSFHKDVRCALRQAQQRCLTNLDDTFFNTKLPTLYWPKFGSYQINTKASLYFWKWIIIFLTSYDMSASMSTIIFSLTPSVNTHWNNNSLPPSYH